jgi:hypothetical protein
LSLPPPLAPTAILVVQNTRKKYYKAEHNPYTLGWVDIGTVARVPLRFVVYLKKSRENDKKLV